MCFVTIKKCQREEKGFVESGRPEGGRDPLEGHWSLSSGHCGVYLLGRGEGLPVTSCRDRAPLERHAVPDKKLCWL